MTPDVPGALLPTCTPWPARCSYELAAAKDYGPARESAERLRKQAGGKGSLLGRLLKR